MFFVNSQREVFKEFGKLPNTACILWMVAIIIIGKNTDGYFIFPIKFTAHKLNSTWQGEILAQPKKKHE